MAKYRNLPAAYHEVPSGKALSPAQRAAFGDMLSAVMRAAHHRGVDERLIEASLGSNDPLKPTAGSWSKRTSPMGCCGARSR